MIHGARIMDESIKVIKFDQHRRNATMQGFITIRLLDSGMKISGIGLHENPSTGKRWLQWPAKPYTKHDGKRGWNYFVTFDKGTDDKTFQNVVLEALDDFKCQQVRGELNGYTERTEAG